MAPQVLRKNCRRCEKTYHTYLEDMVYCNDGCRTKHEYEKRFGIVKDFGSNVCSNCGLVIGGTHKFCNKSCRYAYARSATEVQRNIEANNKETVVKRNKGAVSYEELNRRAEHNRLYDKFHVRRQLEGKARDLI